MNHTANRLTENDRDTIRGRMAETRRMWVTSATGTYNPSWDHVDSLERIGWHAIGCSAVDLRDSELAEIHELAVTAAGL